MAGRRATRASAVRHGRFRKCLQARPMGGAPLAWGWECSIPPRVRIVTVPCGDADMVR